MKRWLARMNMAVQVQRPLRFGRHWRRFETPLRIVQMILFIWLAATGVKLVADVLLLFGKAAIRLLR